MSQRTSRFSVSIRPVSVSAWVAFVSAPAFLSSPAFACAVCFGDPNSSQTHGMNWAITTMLGFVAAAFAGVGLLVIRLRCRAREAEVVGDTVGPEPTLTRCPEALPV